MSEEIPVKKALEADPDFVSVCLLQVLTQHKDLIPNVPVQESDVLEIEFKIQGRDYSFQKFMDRFQEHFASSFERLVHARARVLVDERLSDSLVALEDTAHEARKLFFNRFPELKIQEERE